MNSFGTYDRLAREALEALKRECVAMRMLSQYAIVPVDHIPIEAGREATRRLVAAAFGERGPRPWPQP